MDNIIKLLPDHVANQIAAGEVIQRPGSVVKELLENAIDAGAKNIILNIKDAGKSLIQIIDDGKGMTETDARLCLERHATSKITKADDLFTIDTFGFRGEAMASIAAVARMEIKTKPEKEGLGTRLVVEGSRVTIQEPSNTPTGSSISVKNLFYNIPARRKFLKSDASEFRNIIDEFQRVAIPNFDLSFKLMHNDNELFNLPKSSFRQRLIGVFGKAINQKLVPVSEDTTIVKTEGFIGKPESSRRTRGEQFLFVNGRFIKSNYFHHAIVASYDNLIPEGNHPSYFLLLNIDPKEIDVNIHPTKTEIKFEDEKEIFIILKTTLRKSLGQHNLVPSLDFNSKVQFAPPPQTRQEVNKPGVIVNPDFNPFGGSGSNAQVKTEDWESFFPKTEDITQISFENDIEFAKTTVGSQINIDSAEKEYDDNACYQLHRRYIITHVKSGLMMIHQQRAHERILFERYETVLENKKGFSQQQLFPSTIELGTYDANLVKDLNEELQLLGFDIAEFGKNTFVINGLPSEASNADPKTLIENLIEQYKINRDKLTLDKRRNLAVSLARNTSIKSGRKLNQQEMSTLIDELFGCDMPYTTPSGKNIINMMELSDIEKNFD